MATPSPSPTAEKAPPKPVEIVKIAVPVVLLTLFMLLLIVLVRLRLRRTQRGRPGVAPRAGPATPDAGPALARLQRALAKGGVGATPAELDFVAPAAPFDKLIHEGEDGVCAICLDEMQPGAKVRTLPCSHTFDAPCVEQWAAKANRCPICNAALVDAEALAMRRTSRATSMLTEFGTPRGRRRRERDPDGSFRLAALPPRSLLPAGRVVQHPQPVAPPLLAPQPPPAALEAALHGTTS